mgnify:CR=1 FL=1|tara:strand:- start:2223 stop:2681 length:459 start_codon:yes stop_codon:yes gene_type:complete
MGTYYSSYIGPFLRMPITTKQNIKKVLVDKDGKETSNKFDPKTGEEHAFEIKTYNEEVIPSSYIDDYDDLTEDAFNSANNYSKIERLFYPNDSKINTLGHEDTEWEYNKSLRNINPENEILKFKNEYKEYLSYYEKTYGSFEIDYGIIREGN